MEPFSYQGKVIDFSLETIAQPDGRQMDMEVVRHSGGAVVAALDDQQRICVLRQYRPVINEWLWELPAGKIDAGEPPQETARRELAEEAGLAAGQWRELGKIVSCPGYSDEVMYLYLATDLRQVPQGTEEHEYIEIHWMPLDEALKKADSGVIWDAKTLVALYRTAHKLANPNKRDTW